VQTKYLPIVVAVGFLVGCQDPQAEKQKREALENQKKALEAMAAVQGKLDIKDLSDPPKLVFSASPKEYDNVDYPTGRDRAVEAAINTVKASGSTATPAQKILISRSLANLLMSRANYQTQSALTDWTDLTARTAGLVADTVQLQDAVARANSLAMDQSKIISTLRDNLTETEKEIRDLTEKSAALEKEVTELTEAVATADAKNRELLTSGRKLRSDALLLKGALQYETYKRAIDAESAAAQASFQSQRFSTKLDVVSSEKKIIDMKLTVLQPVAATIKERIATAERRDADAKAKREDAIKRRDAIVQRVRDNFAAIADERQKKVAARFTEAHRFASQALEQIKSAVSAQPDVGGMKRTVGLEEVFKHIANAYIYTQEATATVAYAKSLEQLAAQVNRSMPDMTLFAENAKYVRDSAAIQIKSAKDAIAEAQRLQGKLIEGTEPDDPYLSTEGPGEPRNLLTDAVLQLQMYDKRVEELRNSLGLP